VDTAVALANAKAHLVAAHADLSSTRNRLERLLKLAEEQDLASPEEVDQARTDEAKALARLREAEQALLAAQAGPLKVEQRRRDVDLAKVDVKKAHIAKEEQEDRLRDTRILAPMDGVIIKKLVERGQIIASGISSASGGTPLLNLADTSRLFVSAEIDESDIGMVRPGQAVHIVVDAHEGQEFEGHVIRVAPRGEENQNVTIFRVTVEVTDPRREQLLLGMTAQVRVVVAMVEGAVLVPNASLKMNGDQLGVLLPPETKGGEARFQPVRRGRTDGVVTEILEGLTGGEFVLVRGDALGSASGGRSGFNRNVRRAMWYMRR
jgi:HlyD family secretion protein